ncbi:MAG TPA: holo-ACP synthase [Candidatus Cloacimonadota bacterium]|nr:holo-ACP synthase [Candidatus Cloacimonadota bacterium]HOV17351.1 holo-ACP synthase [Candidatus Cloacimonadota bacterium]HQL15036.1 holo-ACP synthase [Candidatus Cloacimonadota bacterium]
MIAGIGIDIIDINRIRRVLTNNPSFREKVFSAAEIAYCEAKADPSLSYAVRFAAKEAFMKALGSGWNQDVRWAEIETLNLESGAPEVKVSGITAQTLARKQISKIHVSLSHEKDYAVANVILEQS